MALDTTPVLTRRGKSPRGELEFLFQEEDVVGIRTQQWKYVRNREYSPYQPAASDYDYRELYDINKDVSESYNVHTMYPAVEKEMEVRVPESQATFQFTQPSEACRHNDIPASLEMAAHGQTTKLTTPDRAIRARIDKGPGFAKTRSAA